MAPARAERRLAAILAADVVGYSRLVEHDEAETLSALKIVRREVIEPLLAEHQGRIVKLMGDGALVEFGSIVDAVACAVAIQKGVAANQADIPTERRIIFRIGVNLGDVIHEVDGDLYGDGVNIAARLQTLADPGGICISGTAYDHLHGKLDCDYEYLGERALKNMERPVRLYRPLLDGTTVRTARSRLALPDRPSIAVLPFNTMSADPVQDLFSDGLTEDITTALSKLKGFFVIARNTMFTYKGKPVDVRAVGRELGIRYVLEGSVRTFGNRVRVTAQLVDAASEAHLWAERYDGDLGDIFAIQDEITASIVARIGPELLSAEHARESPKPHHGLDAWECVVRAVFLCSQLSEESSRKMLPLLDRAIGLAPDYAQALAMKGWITMWRAFQGWEDMGYAMTLARDVVQQAIAADDKEPWAYLAQTMTAYATRDDPLAMAAVSQAVAINPNSAFAHGQLGLAHANGGRAADAIPCIDYALRLSPREAFLGDFQFYYAMAYFQGANYELGLSYAREAHRLRSGHPYPLIIGTVCAGLLGDQEAATDLLGRLKLLVPDISRNAVGATSCFVRAEDRARLIEGLARAGLD
ncbi:adenylate/guanylate cyclase domain-containing protein [Microvirga guangxiensis]|uniref:TolB amino-terminal domain-containing protein n=1 Tax=Microvirga guangxiensis TaxID=549386 RepID=A0A1G5LLU8_9HYPH|nr:adenylate/guanylate cyclase domain-containing protein [Microvirga guangxiensis]SCZ13897.1 TolB amino-terminal domain-containing protein [Microvirga guangxiensis]